MSGKVTDGQYICEGLVEEMDKALRDHLPFQIQDKFWWPLRWDPAHWIDNIFNKFTDSEIVSKQMGTRRCDDDDFFLISGRDVAQRDVDVVTASVKDVVSTSK